LSDYEFSYITHNELGDIASLHPAVHASGKGPRETQYKDCPNITPEFPCFFYLATRQGKLAVSTRAIPDILISQDMTRCWAWTCDLFTEPAFRGSGLATILQRATTQVLHQRGFGRGSVFSSKVTRRIYQKIGSTLAGYAPRYIALKSAGPFLKAHLGDGPLVKALDRVSGPIIRSIARACWTIGRANAYGRPRIDRCLTTLVPASSDSFASVSYSTPFHFDDSFAAISWKLQQANANPDTRCDFHFLTDRQQIPVGFFITRLNRVNEPLAGKYKDFRLLTLMHFGLFRNDLAAYGALVDHLLEIFWDGPADALEVITNCEFLISAARSRGMLRIGSGMSFTLSVPADWKFAAEEYELRKYWLTHFCGDGFTV
jgi:GNAT superfamily N-acetyltransferase